MSRFIKIQILVRVCQKRVIRKQNWFIIFSVGLYLSLTCVHPTSGPKNAGNILYGVQLVTRAWEETRHNILLLGVGHPPFYFWINVLWEIQSLHIGLLFLTTYNAYCTRWISIAIWVWRWAYHIVRHPMILLYPTNKTRYKHCFSLKALVKIAVKNNSGVSAFLLSKFVSLLVICLHINKDTLKP